MAKINKKQKARQRSIYVPKEIDEKIIKFISNTNNSMTYSEAVNLAIKDFLKIHANKDELSITTEIIENTIRKELKPVTERIIKLLAKSTKSGYSSIFLQAQVLSYLFNTDDQQDFLKGVIEKAEKMGYQATKNYSLDEDITKVCSKGLQIDNI